MTRDALAKGQITHACQDGSREFISLLACISADGSALPPLLIYKGKSCDLRASWVQDLGEEEEIYFAASANGWTCDALGRQWLERVFDRHTRVKAGNRRRLLLLDGHGSHFNMAFLESADLRRIIVMILPPHSTHRLQPLDVGLFSPLATAYSKKLNEMMTESRGMVSMSKGMVLPIFRAAWDRSFTEKNIQSASAKPGIFPVDSSTLLNVLQPSPTAASLACPPSRKLLTTSQALRHAHRECRQNPTPRKLQRLFSAESNLLAENALYKHENAGLKKTLQMEKMRKDQKGKRLNLLGEEDSGPLVFSPAKVIAARAYQDQTQALEELEKAEKATKKAEAAALRQQRKMEKERMALDRQIRRQLAHDQKAFEKVEKATEKARKAAEQDRALAEKASTRAARLSRAAGKKRPVGGVEMNGEARKRRKALPTEELEQSYDSTDINTMAQTDLHDTIIVSGPQSGPIALTKGRFEGVGSVEAPKISSWGRAVRLPSRSKL